MNGEKEERRKLYNRLVTMFGWLQMGFQIDPEPFQIALRTQQAALALAQADLEKAQSRF
jgi:hypothetical protein